MKKLLLLFLVLAPVETLGSTEDGCKVYEYAEIKDMSKEELEIEMQIAYRKTDYAQKQAETALSGGSTRWSNFYIKMATDCLGQIERYEKVKQKLENTAK